MLRVWTIGNKLLFFLSVFWSSLSDMLLSNLIVLGSGAQSVTADRDTRRSDSSNKHKEVRQQGITEYQ